MHVLRARVRARVCMRVCEKERGERESMWPCVLVCAHVYVHMCVGEVDDIESDFINHPDTDKLPMHPHTANGQPLRSVSVSVSCGV